MAAPAEAGLRVTVHITHLAMLAKARCVYGVSSRIVHAIQRACRSIAVRRARSFHRLSPCLGSTVSSQKKLLWTCVLDHTIAVAAVRRLLLLTAYRSGDAEPLIGRQTSASHLWCR